MTWSSYTAATAGVITVSVQGQGTNGNNGHMKQLHNVKVTVTFTVCRKRRLCHTAFLTVNLTLTLMRAELILCMFAVV